MLALLIVSVPVLGLFLFFCLTTALSCSHQAPFVTLPKHLFQLHQHIAIVSLLYPFGFVPRLSPLNVRSKPNLHFHVPFGSLLTSVLLLNTVQVYGSRGRAHWFDMGIRVWACVYVNSSWFPNALWHTAVTYMWVTGLWVAFRVITETFTLLHVYTLQILYSQASSF